jgi:hypothetical protein
MLFGGLEHVAQRTIFANRPINIEAEATTLATLLVDGIAPRRNTDTGSEEDVASLIARLQKAVESLQKSAAKPTG